MTSHVATTMLAVWALILAPAFCRADVMTECCPADRGAAARHEVLAVDCCGESGPCDCRPPEPRGCEPCIESCCPVAKPDDAPAGVHPLVLAHVFLPAQTPAAGDDPAIAHAAVLVTAATVGPALPFHPSDRPLLI